MIVQTMFWDIFRWWLVIQVLGLLALPLAGFLFRMLPDRGYAFSKTLGLLLTGYGAWLLAMLGLGSFGAPLLVIVALIMGGAGLLLRRVGYSSFRLALPQIVAYETLFLAAFIGLAFVRAHDMGFVGPHPWGTERPMDYAFFNAIKRSSVFPPADPWLAGYSINYYYLGYLLMASLALLSGVEGASGYNLALALIFALTALGAAGIVLNLSALSNPGQAPTAEGEGDAPAAIKRSPPALSWLFALLAVIFVLLAGNQSGAAQVLIGDHRVVALDGPQLIAALDQVLAGAEQIRLPYPVRTPQFDFDTFETLERGDRLADFNWWWPSRALWDTYSRDGGTRYYNITEFPYFSFWLGDMHPHVMALPFGLLALALALTTAARAELPTFEGRSGLSELALTALVLGSLYLINSWDLPTYLLFYSGALLLVAVRLTDGQLATIRWLSIIRPLALLAFAIALLFAPFLLTFRSLVGGGEPLVDFPLVGGLTRVIAPYIGARSGLLAFLGIFGLFLLPLVAFAYSVGTLNGKPFGYAQGRRWMIKGSNQPLALIANQPPEPDITEASPISHSPSPISHPLSFILLPALPALLLLAGVLLGFPLLGLLGLGLFAGWLALRRSNRPADSFILLGLALGCAICFGTEIIFIRDVFGNRMNTIFKFYYQTWLLWGVLAAYALWRLSTVRGLIRRIGAGVVYIASAALLAGALVYPALTLRDLMKQSSFVGLAGRTPREQSEAGRASINWLRENAPAGSVVLEMVAPGGGSYNHEGYGGVAASTGLPTILGWVGHQQQWRGGDPIARAELDPRMRDVELIYATPDPEQARSLLNKYSVDYVYIGELERRELLPESLAKFDKIGWPVFSQGEVTIYQLTQ